MPSKKPPLSLGNVLARSIKYWADASTQGFTAAVKEPYINNLNLKGDPQGTLNYNPQQLQNLMAEWMECHWQLIVNANGDRATDQALGCYEAVLSKSKNEKIMHRIEHLTVASPCPPTKPFVQRLWVQASATQATLSITGAKRSWSRYSAHRAMRSDPVHDDSTNNVFFSFHSDSPVIEYPLRYIKTAVTRLMYDSSEILGEKQRVGLETALRGVTVNAAEHVLMGDVIGSLKVKKSADLVILGEDIRKAERIVRKPAKGDGKVRVGLGEGVRVQGPKRGG